MTTNLPAKTLEGVDFNAILRDSGYGQVSDQEFNRIKIDGMVFHAGDQMFVSNPKTKTPAFRARLLDVPAEYQAAWIDDQLGRFLGRENASNSFCKSYFDEPNQARKYAEDGTACESCPINPFTKRENLPVLPDGTAARKCSWRAELRVQILDDDGTISDPTEWLLTLPTTGIIEFKGTAKDPEKGHLGDLNFLQKLMRLGTTKWDGDPNASAFRALSAMRTGGVLVEVRAVPTKSQDGSRSYNVVQLTPYDIIEVDDAPALPAGDVPDTDELPF